MNLPPEEISKLSSACQSKLVKQGKHHWLGPKNNQQLIMSGKHPFLSKDAARARNLKRISEGSHNLLGVNNPVHKLIAAGKHHFQVNNPSNVKIKDGTHHFLTNHPNKVQLTCPHCGKVGGQINMKRYHFDQCKNLEK